MFSPEMGSKNASEKLVLRRKNEVIHSKPASLL